MERELVVVRLRIERDEAGSCVNKGAQFRFGRKPLVQECLLAEDVVRVLGVLDRSEALLTHFRDREDMHVAADVRRRDRRHDACTLQLVDPLCGHACLRAAARSFHGDGRVA
jgi:hypothetical protein